MEKNTTVKNILAAVGAIAVVKTVPLLAAGVAVGAVLTNPEKVKSTMKDGIDKTMDLVEEMLVKSGVPEEELERVKHDILDKEPETIDDLFSDEEEDLGDLKTEEPDDSGLFAETV